MDILSHTKSTARKHISTVVMVVVFLVLAVTALSIYYNGPLIESFSQRDSSSRPANNTTDNTANSQKNVNYFSSVDINYTVPNGVSTFFSGKDELSSINNDDTVITYLAPFSINANNVVNDILNEFAITDELNIEGCTNIDQLAISYQQKTCLNERCIDRFGNRIAKNQIIEEISPNGDIPKCTDQELGYLSFNFVVDPITNLVSNQTLFMNVSEVYVGVSTYKALKENSNLEYYFRHNYFIEDTNIGVSEMIPRIVHSSFTKNDFRQKIIIKRYNKGGEANNRGPLAELIIRPGQLFLDAETVPTAIHSFADGQDFSAFSGNYAVRNIYQGSNITAKCILDKDKVPYIIDGGKGYDQNKTVSILGDDGNASGSFNIVTLPFSKRICMRRREDYSDENRAVWLLAPPEDLSPEGITKENKLTKGYIRDFSDQSPVTNITKAAPESLPTYSKVSPGTVISAIPVNNGEITITVAQAILDNNDLVADFNGNYEYSGLPYSYYQNILYLYSGEITNSLFQPTKSNQHLNPQIYSKYPDFLLKAVNTYPMFANPQNLVLGGMVDVSVFDNSGYLGPNPFYSDYLASVGFCIDAEAKAPSLANGLLLDGAVEWQTINPFNDVIAFTDDYFATPVLTEFGGNAADVISDLTNPSGGVQFIEPVFGKLDSIDATTANYGGVSLPDITGAVVVDLNSNTLNLDPDSTGTIGSGAQAIMSFVSASGASTIIQSMQITKPGNGYASGTFGISAATISPGLTGYIQGLTFNTVDDEYVFKAVTVDKNDPNSPVSPEDLTLNPTKPISFGLTIDPLKNKVISLTDPTIVNGGQNYTTGMSVGINQFPLNSDESVFGLSYNPENINTEFLKKLPYLAINGVTNPSGASVTPAPYPLFTDSNVTLNYNFWEDSPGVYSNSPQQIIYYGDFVGVSLPYNGDPSDGLKAYFKGNKIDDSAFTDIEFLSSLQIPSFYYNNANDAIPIINSYEGLTLKRFIPYRAFTPPKFDSNKNEIIPTLKGDITYVNYNYCQFVPFGIRDFYNQTIDSYDQIPSF